MPHHTSANQLSTTASASLFQQVLHLLEEVVVPCPPPPTESRSRGCPPSLLLPHLLLACLLQTMRQCFSPAAIARSLQLQAIGSFEPLAHLSRQAVRQRLLALGLAPFRDLLQQVQAALAKRDTAQSAPPLAPFATMVVAVDESDLAAVARLCDETKELPRDREGLLVGKLCAVFDVRRHQWLHVQLLSDPFGNGTLAALLLLESLPLGSLILADLGYFGFLWFQYLSDHGHYWISRLKTSSRYRLEHTFYQQDDLLDALVWLGTYRSNHYPYLVRLIQYRHEGTLYRYITNVLDPAQLPLHEVPQLYGRRWDIELAFKLLKRTLGLQVWWACERVLVLQQLLLALCLSQVIAALQGEIAAHAQVDLLDVSVDILMKVLPELPCSSEETLVEMLARRGRQLGLIRPSRYHHFELPIIASRQIIPLPAHIECRRPLKRTVRKRPRHPRRTDPFDFRFVPLLLI